MIAAGSVFASHGYSGTKRQFYVRIETAVGLYLTENHTPELALRIRLKALPDSGDFDEFDLTHFRPGEVYVVPSHLASLLIIAGYAELVEEYRRAEAADRGQPKFPTRK